MSNMQGSGGTYLDLSPGTTLDNVDNTIQGEGVIGNNQATLINEAGGTILANSTGSPFTSELDIESGTVTNNGTMQVNSGNLLHLVQGAFTNFNSGTGTLSGGTYNVYGTAASPGTLQIDALGKTGGEIVTNAATVLLDGPNSDIVDAAGLDALSTLSNNTGSLEFHDQTRTITPSGGTFTNTGSLTLTGGPLKFTLSGDLVNTGSMTLTGNTGGTQGVTLDGGLINEGSMTLTGNTGGTQGVTLDGGLVNEGSLTLTGNTGGSQTITLSGNLANSGSLTLSGVTGLSGTGTITVGGNLDNSGSLTLSTSQTINVSGNFDQTAGSTQVNGTLSAVLTHIMGGTLGGTGTINGNVSTGGGTIIAGAPGVPGTLTIIGKFVQDAGGTMIIDITGANSFGAIDVTGMASLGGTLDINFLDGFTPQPGEDFPFLSYGSLDPANDDFSNIDFTDCQNCELPVFGQGGVVFEPVGPGGQATPEPSGLILLGTALLGTASLLQRQTGKPRRRETN